LRLTPFTDWTPSAQYSPNGFEVTSPIFQVRFAGPPPSLPPSLPARLLSSLLSLSLHTCGQIIYFMLISLSSLPPSLPPSLRQDLPRLPTPLGTFLYTRFQRLPLADRAR